MRPRMWIVFYKNCHFATIPWIRCRRYYLIFILSSEKKQKSRRTNQILLRRQQSCLLESDDRPENWTDVVHQHTYGHKCQIEVSHHKCVLNAIASYVYQYSDWRADEYSNHRHFERLRTVLKRIEYTISLDTNQPRLPYWNMIKKYFCKMSQQVWTLLVHRSFSFSSVSACECEKWAGSTVRIDWCERDFPCLIYKHCAGKGRTFRFTTSFCDY